MEAKLNFEYSDDKRQERIRAYAIYCKKTYTIIIYAKLLIMNETGLL